MDGAVALPSVLTEVEDKLKDRFHDFLVVATDGTNVYCLDSSHTAGIGLAIYAQRVAERGLFNNDA